ncbi:MAG: PD40 domain-containing protein [Anaerolineae bacterium]|nr:PD40 domain-containing protein [Anaerolineae bacterium]
MVKLTLSRFDRLVLLTAAALVAAIALTTLMGDRVGVLLQRVAPLGENAGHSTSPILITFSEPMDRPTVESRLRTDPPVDGAFSWSGQTITFKPSRAFTPGSNVTVILEKGARAEAGREVLSEYRFGFTVAPLQVAYLFPADGIPQNIWIADPMQPEGARQITDSPTGIFDFSVSPDGAQIAFSEANTLENTYDIKLLTLATGELRQLTNCIDASCTNPVWNPNGRQIAYERVEYNTGMDNLGQSPTRIWLIDLENSPATTRPLLNETQILGYSPQWSADGRRIAFYDRGSIATLVHDLSDGRILAVPNSSGAPGTLSPDGSQLAYAELVVLEGGGSRSILHLVDLETGSDREFTVGDDLVSDQRAQWSPDGSMLAVARQNAAAVRGTQIVLIAVESGETQQFTDDPRYANAFFWYDPTGAQLVVQRFPELGEDMQPDPLARPQIWTFDLATGGGVMVANNGFLPRWIP